MDKLKVVVFNDAGAPVDVLTGTADSIRRDLFADTRVNRVLNDTPLEFFVMTTAGLPSLADTDAAITAEGGTPRSLADI